MSNIVLEQNHHVLGNLVQTYNINKTFVDEDYLWSRIVMVAVFKIHSACNRLKDYSPGN